MEAFRRVTENSGLMLHAAADLRLDPLALQAEYAAMIAVLPEEERQHYGAATGSGWTAVPLLDWRGERPALTMMPTVRALLAAHPEWSIARSHLLRQPPRGRLAWHYEPQALYLPETRLLIPVHQPPGAITLLGHEAVAYPEGQCWTGDFSFPHQVENPGDRERIVVAIDVMSCPAVTALFPAAMTADQELRSRLSAESAGMLKREPVA